MTKTLPFLIFISLLFLHEKINGQKTDWASENEYFQVYSFSKNVEGITIELGINTSTQNKIIDSVFTLVEEIDSLYYLISKPPVSCKVIDTQGMFKFYRNLMLEKKLLNDPKRIFYIYCIKGVVERTINDVVFSLDPCISNIIVFRFAPVDKKIYGQPIFCTQKKLPLNYGSFPEATKAIQALLLNEDSYYKDSIKTIVFAQSDSLYFTFNDNFNWNTPKRGKCYSPGRGIYAQTKNKKYGRKWALGLDLFGVPCD